MVNGTEYKLLLAINNDGEPYIACNKFEGVPYQKCLEIDPGPEIVYVNYEDEMSISIPQGLAQDQHWVPAPDDEERFYCDNPDDPDGQMSMPARMTIVFNFLRT